MATGLELDLHGRRALITGASRGLGRHIAALLAQHGARVAVHCRAAEHDAPADGAGEETYEDAVRKSLDS